MPVASLPPEASPGGALTVSSLPSLHASFTCEHAILEQLLYKNKNQHRRANYYQQLMAVARHNRHINLTPPAALASLASLRHTAHSLRRSLSAALQAAQPLYALLRQTYFMPFALAALAVLARLLAVGKAALMVVLAEAKEREEREADTVRLFAARSVGTALLRAVRERRVEQVVAAMDGYELDEVWTGAVALEAREPSRAQKEDEPLPASLRPPSTDGGSTSEGDSDSDSISMAAVEDDGDTNQHSAFQSSPPTARTSVTPSRQSPSAASVSATGQPSHIRTLAPVAAPAAAAVTAPLLTAPHARRQSPVASQAATTPSHSAPAASTTATAAAPPPPPRPASKKRTAASLTEATTPTLPAASTPSTMRGRIQQPVGVRRPAAAIGVTAAKSAVAGQGRGSAVVDDIDAIFGF